MPRGASFLRGGGGSQAAKIFRGSSPRLGLVYTAAGLSTQLRGQAMESSDSGLTPNLPPKLVGYRELRRGRARRADAEAEPGSAAACRSASRRGFWGARRGSHSAPSEFGRKRPSVVLLVCCCSWQNGTLVQNPAAALWGSSCVKPCAAGQRAGPSAPRQPTQRPPGARRPGVTRCRSPRCAAPQGAQ